jgi:nitroreductase
MAALLDLDPYVAVQEPVPEEGDQRLSALLAWAVLSPSPHNTQPWLWSVRDGVIELRRDNSRLLGVSDPDGREMVIGCGSALEHLLLRLGIDGDQVTVVICPDPSDTDLLARVTVGEGEPYLNRPELVEQMRWRRTNRTGYRGEPMSTAQRDALLATAASFGVDVYWLDSAAHRDASVDFIMAADRDQMANPDFRKELAHWMRPEHSHQMDGMEADLLGQHGVAAYVAPLIVRTFDVGKMQSAKDASLTEGSPDICVFHTPVDDPINWMATGRALAHFTLEAMSMGRASAYMNQPCEVPHLRAAFRQTLCISGFPQLLLRSGIADETHAALRRPVAEVLTSP